ncbi:ubiquitin fusion degradation protein, partial [Coemansia sp. RSA 2599]
YADDSDEEYGFGFGGFHPPGAFNVRRSMRQRQFREHYSAYPITFLENKSDANYGGKIFMPPSALEEISQREVTYPLLFRVQTEGAALAAGDSGAGKHTHCGVLEFTAEEGRVYLPQWMMDSLGISPGAVVEVINVELLHGTMTKLQPQSIDFLDISDHRAVLENALRKFSALTVGDIIAFRYNERDYRIAVVETQPSSTAINIVETDLSVDFAPPVGYVEPTRPGTGVDSRASNCSSATGGNGSGIAKDIRRKEEAAKEGLASNRFEAFRGSGNRLSSRSVSKASADVGGSGRPASVRSYASNATESKVPNSTEDVGDEENPVPLDVPIGTLFFGYKIVPPPGSKDRQEPRDDDDQAKFQGSGRALRQRRKR